MPQFFKGDKYGPLEVDAQIDSVRRGARAPGGLQSRHHTTGRLTNSACSNDANIW